MSILSELNMGIYRITNNGINRE
jgi:hypothetical protein